MLLQYLLLRARLFFKRTDGASAIEYAIIIAMVAVVVITFITPLGAVVKSTFNTVLVALGGTAIP
jgi:pilus assembly protein Flp/PilA